MPPVTVGDWVARNWRTAQVFSRYGIDFCCGGKQTLQQACAEKSVDAAALEKELEICLNDYPPRSFDFKSWELSFLADYIIQVHHRYVAASLPFLVEMGKKVLAVHGPAHPELEPICENLGRLADDLGLHMRKEEVILFPYIRQLDEWKRTGVPAMAPPFGSAQNPIAVMEAEHSDAGEALHEMERLSGGYAVPPGACVSFQAFYAKLREFQDDLHQHVHLENNILFPGVEALEQELREAVIH